VERLGADNATACKDEVFALSDQKHDRLVIDLEQVSFIDSSGIGALVGLLKKLGTRGDVVICGMADNVRQMFRITRMDRVFSCYSDREEAFLALETKLS
jgi:anti-sigma B factor antagonist